MADPASNMVLRFLFIVAAICLSGIHAADIKIAYMAPFLRPQAFYQLQYAQHESVLRYYMDEINQSGTLSTSNYNFTLTYLRNDATTPAGRAEGSQSIINVLDLVQRQNVSAIIGEPFSYNTISSALVSSRFNIPQCSQSASTDDLSNKGSFGMFMRTTATNSGSGRLYVKYFIEKFGWKKFALAYSRDTFGASLVDGMQAAINEAGGTIAKQVFFTVSNNVSACDAVEQLKSTDARIFLCAALESDCMYLIGCAHRAGLVNPDNVWISGRELPLESDMLKPPYGPEFMSNFSNVFHLKRINGLPESPEYQTFLQKWDQMGRNPQIYNGTDQPMQSYSTAVYHCLRLFVRGFKTQLDEAVRTGPLRGRALEDAFLAGTLVPRLNLTMFNDTMTMGPKGPLTIDENGDGYDLVEVDSIYQGKASAIGFIDYSGKTSLTGTAKFFDGSAIIPPDRPPSEDVGLTWKDAGSIALAIITLLLVCITIVFVVFIVLNKNERIIKASSPLFLVVMAIGNLLVYAHVLTLVGIQEGPSGSISCGLHVWTLSVGASLVFGSVLAKTWRISRIFNSSHKLSMGIPNSHVATAATLLTLPTIIILIAWTVLDATKPVLVTLTNVTHYYACAAPTRFPFNYIIVGYVGLLLMITSYLCYKVRSVPSNFNESRHLLFAVTITLICAIVAVVVREEAGKQYFLIISIHTTMILAANTVMVFATLGIKIFLLSQAHSRQNTNFRSGQYTISLMSKHTKLEDINLGGPAGHEMSGVGSDGKKNIGVARRQEVLASVQLNEGGGKGFMENWCDCTLHVSAYKPFVILFKKVTMDPILLDLRHTNFKPINGSYMKFTTTGSLFPKTYLIEYDSPGTRDLVNNLLIEALGGKTSLSGGSGGTPNGKYEPKGSEFSSGQMPTTPRNAVVSTASSNHNNYYPADDRSYTGPNNRFGAGGRPSNNMGSLPRFNLHSGGSSTRLDEMAAPPIGSQSPARRQYSDHQSEAWDGRSESGRSHRGEDDRRDRHGYPSSVQNRGNERGGGGYVGLGPGGLPYGP